ncbi:MAG: hypothetical protein ATN31_04125 [Candidatus Epulonipiscioides saccharophilum]|nr:MAG: hypothetical protein ATN31_04125 [Epulopiscium sp. AS2M-Bin001]
MKKTILKGAAILAVASFISKIIGMLYKIPITNLIGDQGNALYASAYNIYILIITLTAIGMPTAISKLVSERRAVGANLEAHRVYKIALTYSSITSIVLATMLWVGAEFIAELMKNKDLTMPLRALSPTCVIVTIMAVTRGYLQGIQDMAPTAISQIIEQIFNAIFSILLAFIFIRYGVIAAATGSTVGTGLGAVFGLIVITFIYCKLKPILDIKRNHKSRFTNESRKKILHAILITIIPIVLSTSIFAIITNIDTLMLNTYLPRLVEEILKNNSLPLDVTNGSTMTVSEITNSLTGQYLGKYLTLINVPVAVILTIAMAATPSIADSVTREEHEEVREKINMIVKVGMLIAAPSAVGLTLFSDPIMKTLYMQSPDGHKLLMYGSVSIIFIALAQLTTGVLQGMSLQMVATKNAFIACIIKIVFNFIFLQFPYINIYSVVYSTTICYIIFAILNLNYLKRKIGFKLKYNSMIIRPLFAAAWMGLMALAIYEIIYYISKSMIISLSGAILSAMIFYLIIGIFVKAITIEDLNNIPGGSRLIPLVRKITH